MAGEAWRDGHGDGAGAADAVDGAVARPVIYRDGARRPGWSGYTAFVLSGGGARGAIQVGMLRALLEHGERPDVVVGTSIGAWNGAWLARDATLAGLDGLVEIWRGLTTTRVLLGREPYGNPPARAVSGMLMLAAVRRVTQGYAALYGDVGLRQLAARLIGERTFADLALPLRIVATDLTLGTRAVFASGPLAPAVLASSAIPGIFPPVHIGGRVYVDGGALENASLDVAVALGARRLFVLDVGYDTAGGAAPEWSGDQAPGTERIHGNGPHPLAAVLERTTQVMSNYHLERTLRQLAPGIERHLIRPGAPAAGGTLDFSHADEAIELGYALARDYLRAALPAGAPKVLGHLA